MKKLSISIAAILLVGAYAASSVMAVTTLSETFPGNYACSSGDALNIDPVADGTYNLVGGGTITIDVRSTSDGPVFDFWTSGALIDSIVVKGGPNYHVYTFVPGVDSATGLHAPLNPNNGKWYGLSHLCIESTKKSGGDPDPKK